ALLTQMLKAPHAAFVARAPRLDALADPGLLLRPELVELALHDGFDRELSRFQVFVTRVIPGKGEKLAPIELDDARRDAVEEGAVVRHHDRRRLLLNELFQRE